MPDPVTIHFHKKKIKRFSLIQCKVTFSDNTFHHESMIGERNFHNAYDADENFTLFRADAVFTHKQKEYTVPVFPVKKHWSKPWEWWVRFSPHLTGSWSFRIQVVSWHQNPAINEPDTAKRSSNSNIVYYEHKFGYEWSDYQKYSGGRRNFHVYDTRKLSGPLEAPSPPRDNSNYFYRWMKDGKAYKRHPCFLLGLARPWVSENKKDAEPYAPDWAFHSHMDREKDLFEQIKNLGQKPKSTSAKLKSTCYKVLLHWMAPWESQLIHQSPYEHWYQPAGIFKKKQTSSIKNKNYPYDGKLDSADSELGYKRYDQGRALHTDKIFDLAWKNQVMLFLVVMPHGLLRDAAHPWPGYYFGKAAEEFSKKGKKKISVKIDGKNKERKIHHPSNLNGFQLFEKDSNKTISIKDFFSMNPVSKIAWQRKLWKHYANFWRYLIGRWTAHPALAGWILIDEMDGVGTAEDWWWDKKNQKTTYKWHDNIIKLLRGDPNLEWKMEGENLPKLPYAGDYLNHPITSSATDYEGTNLRRRCEHLNNLRLETKISDPNKRKEISRQKCNNYRNRVATEKNTKKTEAIKLINRFGEIDQHGNWGGAREKIDFISHHAYHVVPTWGEWSGSNYQHSSSFTGWHKTNSEKKAKHIYTHDRWLWESLCMRLYKWSLENGKAKCPRLITEYGCWERDNPAKKYHQYGKRYPSYTHFASWAALILGHAGIPFKWNDGKGFGEMIGRTKKTQASTYPQTYPQLTPWDPVEYPVDNYAEILNITNFLDGVDLDGLYPTVTDQRLADLLYVVDQKNNKVKTLNSWALSNLSRTDILAWIYDRTFSRRSLPISLELKVFNKDTKYEYRWFDTWTGRFFKHGKRKSDGTGTLKISIPTFPVCTKKTIAGVSDGNDVAVRIKI